MASLAWSKPSKAEFKALKLRSDKSRDLEKRHPGIGPRHPATVDRRAPNQKRHPQKKRKKKKKKKTEEPPKKRVLPARSTKTTTQKEKTQDPQTPPKKKLALLPPPTSASESDNHKPEDVPKWKEKLPFIIRSAVAQVLNVDSDGTVDFEQYHGVWGTDKGSHQD
ncbi:hypothetical protein KEM48_004756 [Puccinia striiformis f. sp. tritici PST-130]|nr:hypothetical protein KEM48_004756 [Puccinia striiformis f. sp. tritici PST-130]